MLSFDGTEYNSVDEMIEDSGFQNCSIEQINEYFQIDYEKLRAEETIGIDEINRRIMKIYLSE
jgi:hypothetical protein